jgi:hypothetical protein
MQNAIDAAKSKQDIVAHLIEHRLSPLTIAESIS